MHDTFTNAPTVGTVPSRFPVSADGKPATTVIVIDEVDSDNWGTGGESVTTRWQRG
jgi:hypothetical protein